MKLIIVKITVLLSLIIISFGCSEIKEDISTQPKITLHPEGFGDAASPNFHKYTFAENNWSFSLLKCQGCHAADYSGGLTGTSCTECHSQSNGPEACNTCHGEFANPDHIAPPNDLEDNSENSVRGVGAHYVHVYSNNLSSNIGCFECHKEVAGNNKFVHEHISPPPAKMEFGEFTNSDSLGVSPLYDFNSLTCSNTYCHGGFKFGKAASENSWAYTEDYIVGNNYTPVWNSSTEKEAECGTCHGEIDGTGNLITPQPKGHFGNFVITDCANCHGSVVNSAGEIINKLKHIDKKVDYL